jgi:AbrB family looped-hinge helix DNA binding protein
MKARLSSKGQIVLPKYLRDKQGWKAGAEIDIQEVPGGVLLRFFDRAFVKTAKKAGATPPIFVP